MPSESRFSVTMPAALEDMTDIVMTGDERPGYRLVGVIGAQLTEPLGILQRQVNALMASGALNQLQAQPLGDVVRDIGKLAVQSQLLMKVADGRGRYAHEQVDLHLVVNHILDEHAHSFRLHGVQLHRSIKPVAVMVNPELVAALIDAAIDWVGELGQRLVVSLEVKNWPANAVLKLRTSQTVTESRPLDDGTQMPERLSWYLVTEIARAIGAVLERDQSTNETFLTLEFPRTVQTVDGLTATEMDLGSDAWMGNASRNLAGHRVLIVSSDIKLREDAKTVCRSLGMMVDSVPTSLMAVRFCEMEAPELIIVDERFKDEQFDELRSDLLRMHPNFPFIEIAYESNALTMAGWMGENMTRINRDEMAHQLPEALAIEMSKVL